MNEWRPTLRTSDVLTVASSMLLSLSVSLHTYRYVFIWLGEEGSGSRSHFMNCSHCGTDHEFVELVVAQAVHRANDFFSKTYRFEIVFHGVIDYIDRFSTKSYVETNKSTAEILSILRTYIY